MSQQNENQKSDTAKKEEKVLSFWKENNIFKKTLEKKSPKGEFVFYDGPPFATGLPHYGHILPGSIKDAVPRYKTMQGYHVRRQWGWDCHGLPIENLVEKELGLETKKDIEELGIEKFNTTAEKSVLRFADDWRRIILRTGRWVDMDRDYKTMDWSYTESVWWVFKTLFEKKLIYEGFKSMHLCPRCETTLSNFEVAQGYLDIVDFAVTVKFYLKDDPQTSLLIWTTTPWTLPGNMGVAVGEDFDYVEIDVVKDGGKERFIVAKERLDNIIDSEYIIVRELKGKELIGKEYEPPFDYYKDASIKNKENAWKIYAGSFVTLDEGTGIVHLAPAFGEDDMKIAQKENIPIVHHVDTNGVFKKEVRDFVGMQVKPKGDHQKTDIEIIKNLAHRNLLFAKNKVTHSYPHCWRCDTPLLNYASNSWFVKVTEIKNDILKANKKVSWIPKDIRDGRFGKWLEGARDWAVSRTRYWGAPIPVWKCGKCDLIEVIGSVEEMREKNDRSKNNYFTMRHGESVSNENGILNSRVDSRLPLTPKGKKEAQKALKYLKQQNIDLIFVSPLQRTKDTAHIIARGLGVKRDKVIYDERLREISFGVLEGKDIGSYAEFLPKREDRFWNAPPQGETLLEVKKRVMLFLLEINEKYTDKNILIISHDSPIWMLASGAAGVGISGTVTMRRKGAPFSKTGEARKFNFAPLPYNKSFELDLHRPHIDEIKFACSCGGRMKRVSEVFDCWFESGSMPYGGYHYPYENTDIFDPKKKKGFPADFIAEGLDQTRGWFYSLLVLGVALFGKSPYKNVIVHGLVLAEDGRKMSKRLNNYPDPFYIMDRYGADALRLYLLGSPVIRGEDLNFSEKGVGEVQNKIITRFSNVGTFYKLYKIEGDIEKKNSSENVLDKWIMVRLGELVNMVTQGMENYELDKAIRPLGLFVDDLSTWYLRRSRERFKGSDEKDKKNALATTQHVLETFSKIIAPFAPFVAEEMYQKIKDKDAPESVHLCEWPQRESRIPIWPNPMALFHRVFGTHGGLKILKDMQETRDVVSLALEARMNVGVKVRQPLQSLTIKKETLKGKEELLKLVKDEVNIKEIIFDKTLEVEVTLDTNITPELRAEGVAREFIRHVQDLRKSEGWTPSDVGILTVHFDKELIKHIKKSEDFIKEKALLNKIIFSETDGEEIKIDNFTATIKIEKYDE